MKVLFVSRFPPEKDGVGDYTYELSLYLKKYCEVGVLTFKTGKSEENIFRLLNPNNKLIFHEVIRYIKLLCKEKNYDIIHFQTASFTFPRNFYIFPLFLDVNLISTIHEVLTIRQFHYLPFVFNVYHKSKVLITLSKEIAKFLIKYYRIDSNKVRVIKHGADINRFHPNVDQRPFRELYNVKEDFIIMILGFVGKGKGHDILIKAFKKIHNKIPDAKLIIAGGTKDENYKNYLKKLALPIKEKVIFTDYIPYELLPSCLASADIFILPYIGGVHVSGPLHRALASGRPIIASESPIVKEIIIHGYNGILIKPEIEELAKTIVELYENKELRNKLSHNARKFAEEFLDWDKIAKQTLRIYKEVVEK